MIARLVVVALLAVAGLGLNAAGYVQFQPVRDAGEQIQLLPDQIGNYQRTTDSWRNQVSQGVIENGAVYKDRSGASVQLDFFRHGSRPHNGLGCYLVQGETLLWERVQNLPTRTGSAEFDLGMAQTRESLRLVAATECRVDGCREDSLAIWRKFGDFKKLIFQLFSEPTGAVVPVSIVFTTPADQRDPAVEADLMVKLQEFIAALDLAPVRTLAALQGGQTPKPPDAASPHAATGSGATSMAVTDSGASAITQATYPAPGGAH